MMHTKFGAILLGTVLLGQPLGAQQRTEMVPKVLATSALSIFSPMFPKAPSLTADSVPAGWPTALTPRSPASIIGGADMGFIKMGVFRWPTGENLVGRYESLLVRAGATRQPSRSETTIAHGFAPAEKSESGEHAFCFNGGSVEVEAADSALAKNAIVVSWSSSLEFGGVETPCDQAVRGESGGHAPLTLPPLAAPRGVRVSPGGSGGSSTDFQFSASTDTTWTADSLIAHYAREFRKAGWTVGIPVADTQTGIVSLAKPGDAWPWRGALYVVTGPDRRELIVRMLRTQKL